MSKKMKKLTPDSAPYGAHEDAKMMFKYQTLMQDYQELQNEVKETGNKLETVKQRKLILLAEVRFLRQRYKYLLKNKPAYPPPERELTQPLKFETQCKNNTKNQIYGKGMASCCNIHSSHDLNKKGRVHIGKGAAPRKASPVFDLNHTEPSRGRRLIGIQNPNQLSDLNNNGGKEAAVRNLTPNLVIDLNQNARRYGGNNVAPRNADPPLDLNQKERAHSENEAPTQNRAPIFDLNEISGEEEDFQNICEPIVAEEPKRGLIRGGSDEQLNDLKLPICRNVGDGSTRIGKRKISWQDPVALRV